MSLPVFAIYQKRRVKILYYHGHNRWMVLDRGDQRRLLPTSQLEMLP